MSALYVSYVGLSPGMENPFVQKTHQVVVTALRRHFSFWHDFFEEFEGYDLGFIFVTDRDVKDLTVKGPSISLRQKIVDFSIFLPENIETLRPYNPKDIRIYLDLIFSGITTAMTGYNITAEEIDEIKDECLLDLGAGDFIQ